MQRLLITGGSGFIGGNLARTAAANRHVTATYNTRLPDLDGIDWIELDITDAEAVRRAFAAARPDAVCHLAAVSNIDLCEDDHDLADAVNVEGTKNVAAASFEVGARLVAISTDNVFDGVKGGYTEDDPVNPINHYGRTKVLAEEIVQDSTSLALVVRIPLTLGFPVTGCGSHLAGIVAAARKGGHLWFVSEEWRSPIDVHTLSDALLELADDTVSGVLHVGGTERISRATMGEDWLGRLGVPLESASWLTARDDGRSRPADISLDATRAYLLLKTRLPDFRSCMDRIWRNAASADVAL